MAVALAAVPAGCGDDEAAPTTTTTTEPLTKTEFLRQADRICFSSEAQIEAAVDELVAGRREPPPAEVRRIARRVVAPKLRAEAEAIRALGAPEGDAAKVERILAATERGADQLVADPEAAVDELPSGLREAERLARRYGSEHCGIRE
jgi:hypothetical protein